MSVELDTGSNRIDFQVASKGEELPCPACDEKGQRIHDQLERTWRHLDFFQYEAWIHAKVPGSPAMDVGRPRKVDEDDPYAAYKIPDDLMW